MRSCHCLSVLRPSPLTHTHTHYYSVSWCLIFLCLQPQTLKFELNMLKCISTALALSHKQTILCSIKDTYNLQWVTRSWAFSHPTCMWVKETILNFHCPLLDRHYSTGDLKVALMCELSKNWPGSLESYEHSGGKWEVRGKEEKKHAREWWKGRRNGNKMRKIEQRQRGQDIHQNQLKEKESHNCNHINGRQSSEQESMAEYSPQSGKDTS